mmetsp:Transcript_49317/g.102880  ORF Transcript_49317/g.102880 Transcript_49317/m.102880 type:complete len:97 (+) Transcript_49317:112-402(+)
MMQAERFSGSTRIYPNSTRVSKVKLLPVVHRMEFVGRIHAVVEKYWAFSLAIVNEVADLGIGRVLVDWHLKTKKSAELMHLSCCLGMYEHHETAVE